MEETNQRAKVSVVADSPPPKNKRRTSDDEVLAPKNKRRTSDGDDVLAPKQKALPIDANDILRHISYEIEHSTGQDYHPHLECPHCKDIMEEQVMCNSLNHTVFSDKDTPVNSDSDSSVSDFQIYSEQQTINLNVDTLIFKEMTSKRFISCQKCKNPIDLGGSYLSLAQGFIRLGLFYSSVAANIILRYPSN